MYALPFGSQLDVRVDEVRGAIRDAVAMARARVEVKASLVTRIEDGSELARGAGLLAHVVTELLLDAANAFPGELADGNVIVLTCKRFGRFAVVRIADNAPGLPRHAPYLGPVVTRLGGELKIDSAPGEGVAVTVLMPILDQA